MANDRIHELLESFANEIRAEVQRQAMVALSGGFVGGAKHNGHTAKAPRASSRGKGAKRDPKALESLVGKLGAFIAKHPGLRIEEINKQMGTSTKELALPIRKLIAAKAIRSKGAKRSTKYYGGGKTAKKSKG